MNKFAEMTADGERLDLPLSQALLSAEWHLPAAPIRAVHERRPVTLIGRATVVRGWGWLPRLFGWLSGRSMRSPSAVISANLFIANVPPGITRSDQ